MARTRNTITLAVVAALIAIPIASAANGPTTQSTRALELRGQALNQVYHLGQFANPSAQSARALELRGQALNRFYHLGQFANPSAQSARALELRGQALNRFYHLGIYSRATGSSFDWSGVEIGGGAALGAILIAIAAAVGLRRRRTPLAA